MPLLPVPFAAAAPLAASVEALSAATPQSVSLLWRPVIENPGVVIDRPWVGDELSLFAPVAAALVLLVLCL